MAKPSIYRQLEAVQVRGEQMKPSPRHWNAGLLRYKGRLWMAYRYHLGPEHGSRSAIGLVPLDKTTLQPTAPTQHLNLPATVGDEHFEDPRLFLFNGAPHLSYTKMTGYQPGQDYQCVMNYARLKLLGNRWLIEAVYHPAYGRNGGASKEKNWMFFEHEGKLLVVYEDAPKRRVIVVNGDQVVAEHESEPAAWPWGAIRGGAPPILLPAGRPLPDGETTQEGSHFLAIFHSSTPTEEPPHYVRYYGGAYVFEAKAPYRIVAVSAQPLMAGSEADGHGVDPRYSKGWKPYVVFPCGCVPDGADWLVSLGVNDWQCAVGRVRWADLRLVLPDRSDAPWRYFVTLNGTLPVKTVGAEGQPEWLHWEIPAGGIRGNMAPPGLFATNDGREAEALADAPRVEEVTEAQYRAQGGRRQRPVREPLPAFG